MEVLQQCPALVELFNTQLSERLVDCYGSDPRITSDDDDTLPSGSEQNKDFTWILSNSASAPPSRRISQAVSVSSGVGPSGARTAAAAQQVSRKK